MPDMGLWEKIELRTPLDLNVSSGIRLSILWTEDCGEIIKELFDTLPKPAVSVLKSF